jgi:hypothetical protein
MVSGDSLPSFKKNLETTRQTDTRALHWPFLPGTYFLLSGLKSDQENLLRHNVVQGRIERLAGKQIKIRKAGRKKTWRWR